MSVVKRRFGDSIRQEVVGEAMRDNYIKALQEQDINPAGWPKLEPKTMEEGKDLEFVATFEVLPEIELGDLSKINVEKPVSEVADKDIDNMIDNLRRQQATMKEVKRKSKNKDIVTIDFKGSIDGGEEFEGGSAEGHRLTLGSGQMIPGFEKGIVGGKAGEELEIDVTFPEDYHNEDLAGKDAKFAITIHKVEEPQLPELDQEFFKRFGIEAEDEAAFREEVKKNMERELKQAVSNKVKNDVVDGLLETTELEVPAALVDQEIDRLRQDAVQRFGGQVDFQQLPKEIFEEQAKRRVKTGGLLFQEVVKKNDLKADEAKVEEKIQEIASTYEQPDEVVAHFNSNPDQKAQVESSVLEDAVVDFVLGAAKVKEKKMKYEEAVQAGQPPQR